VEQTDARAVVTALHTDLLRRDAESGVLEALAGELSSHGDCSRVLHQLMFGDEHLDLAITEAYRLVFRRAPSRSEITAQMASIRSGKTWLSDVPLGLLDTVSQDRSQTTASLLALLYDVALDRELTVAEMSHWVRWLNNRSRSSLPQAVWKTPEAVGVRVARVYRAHLWRDPDPSGTAVWGPRMAKYGDEPVRAGLVSSLEYLILARARERGSRNGPPLPTPAASNALD
jgi:hypothetical protein